MEIKRVIHEGGWLNIKGQDYHLDKGTYDIECTTDWTKITKVTGEIDKRHIAPSCNATSPQYNFKERDKVRYKGRKYTISYIDPPWGTLAMESGWLVNAPIDELTPCVESPTKIPTYTLPKGFKLTHK